jgi:hypothetical protein
VTLDMTYEQQDRLVHTARHLTGAELDRLLHRYDLPETARRILDRYEAENGWGLFEMWCEQMAERGCGKRYYTRLEQHYRAHPVYGPQMPPPPNWRDGGDDDIPF